MTFEALFYMAAARFTIIFIPFRHVASSIGKIMCETPREASPDTMKIAGQIAMLINKLSRYTPWESKCFVNALAGQIMLKRRKIPSTLYMGIAKESDKLSAHAWLRCGSSIILGENERSGFTAIAYFANL